MYPPGRIIHLVERNHDATKGLRSGQKQFSVVWSNRTNFESVLVAERMIGLQAHQLSPYLASSSSSLLCLFGRLFVPLLLLFYRNVFGYVFADLFLSSYVPCQIFLILSHAGNHIPSGKIPTADNLPSTRDDFFADVY